jgi:RecJ-like exonuclease
MTKQILIEKGYTIPDRYLELDDCEVLCENCKGSGKVIEEYRYFGNTYTECLTCGGYGKRLKCTNCGTLCNHGKLRHNDRPDFDTLCLNCIKAKLGIKNA